MNTNVKEAIEQLKETVTEIGRGLDGLGQETDLVAVRDGLEELHASLLETAKAVKTLMEEVGT